MTEQLHTFASGATSGELKPRYNLTTGFGEKVTALRFGYGNDKHEASTTVLAEANWLKGFHARDLKFFQDRMNHAREHLRAESQGNFDSGPGGNWGAIGWCVDIMPFVQQYDPEFYNAIVGIAKHPGVKEGRCPCPRCEADPSSRHFTIPAGAIDASQITANKIVDVKPYFRARCAKCSEIYEPGLRYCCSRCGECCTCL